MIKPRPGYPIETQDEDWILRACLWAEARGESAVGRLAVAWVIRNRALHADTTLKHEIIRPFQFSSFNKNDPNRELLMVAHVKDPAGWGAVDAIAELFEQNATEDPTEGARSYYNPDVAHPKWGRGHAGWLEHKVIGSHCFGIAAGS